MSITSTPEFQDAQEAAEAVGDITSELNGAEDAIENEEWEQAQAIIRSQIEELQSVLGWLNEQAGEDSNG